MKNTIALITSLIILFTTICLVVGNLLLIIFAIIPAFVFLVAEVLKEFTTLNNTSKNEGYVFVYNIKARDYIMVSEDALPQYKNNASFIIPQ